MIDHNYYTLPDITTALHAGADLIQSELDLGERDEDLIGLVVEAALSCLDDPDTSLDHVVRDTYDYPPDEVRGWWSSWS